MGDEKILFASDRGHEEEVRQVVEYASPKIPDLSLAGAF
jgi:hypothetical protein